MPQSATTSTSPSHQRALSLSLLLTRFTTVALVQGAYYLGTGLWPLFHISSFLWVTGPKTDLWLVHTVGVLIAVIGAVLVSAALRRSVTFEIRLLALGSAVGLTGIEVVYVSLDRIAPIYLLDAALEIGLIAWWIFTWRKGDSSVFIKNLSERETHQ